MNFWKIARKVAGFSCAAIAIGANAFGECECDQYKDLMKYESLAQEVSLIGMSAVARNQNALQIILPENIPPECRKELLLWRQKQLDVVMRGFFQKAANSKAPYEDRYNIATANTDRLGQALGGYCSSLGEPPPEEGYYCSKSVSWSDPKDRAKFANEYISKRSNMQIAEDLAIFEPETSWPEDEINVYRTFSQAVMAGSESEMLAVLKAASNKLTVKQKFLLVQSFGSQLAAGYDEKQAADVLQLKFKKVSNDEMLAASKSNFSNSLTSAGEAKAQPDLAKFAGICSNIAPLQVEMLRTLGIKKSYVLNSSQIGGMHSSIIAIDPDDPHVIYNINYDKIKISTQKEGTSVVQRGAIDTSIHYTFLNPDGSALTSIPAELNKVMGDAAGFSIKNIDPLARQSNSMVVVQKGISEDGSVRARVFAADDANHAKYAGVGIDKTVNPESQFQTKLGAAVAYQNNENAHKVVLYLRGEQRANTPDIQLGQTDLKLRGEGEAIVIGSLAADPKEVSKSGVYGLGPDVSLTGNAGVRLTQGSTPSDSPIRDRVQSNFYAGIQGTGSRGFLLNYVMLSGEARVRLSDDNQAYAIASATVLCGQLGCRSRADLTAVYQNIAASLSYEGALTKDMMPLADNVYRKLNAGIVILFPKAHLKTAISGFKSLDTDDYGATGSVIFTH